MASTQKARGLNKLHWFARALGGGLHYTQHSIYPAISIAQYDDDALATIIRQQMVLTDQAFVRPCPTRPRHGFVDSTAITYCPDGTTRQVAVDALRKIAQDSVAADPDSELAISQFIPAKANAILTPSMVTIGPGHDGATAGRASISLPIPTKIPAEWRELLRLIGVNDDESPYFEFVNATSAALGHIYLTQVRAGPRVGAGDDYVPRDTNVTCVIEIDGTEDLLEWEERVKKFSAGTVVWHPGGSIASHFGVHCVLNKVPYITTSKPLVWTKLRRTTSAQWTTDDYQHVAHLARAIDQRMNHPQLFIADKQAYAKFVIGGLHAMGSLMQSRTEYCFRVAAATLAMAVRLFSAVAIGEMRHATDDTDYGSPVQEFSKKIDHYDRILNGYSDRNSVYSAAMELPMNELLERVMWSYYGYSQPLWHSGYGGPPWADCAASTINYGLALSKFLNDPSEVTFRHATQLLNEAVNKAHNNGWWLNKVMEEQVMHRLSARPATGFINRFTYDLLTANLPRDSLKNDYSEIEWYLSEVENEARRMLKELPGYEEEDSGFSLGILRLFRAATMDDIMRYTKYAHPAYITPSGHLAIPGIRNKTSGRMVYANLFLYMNTLLGVFGDSLLRPKDDTPVMWVGTYGSFGTFLYVPWSGHPKEVMESITIWANMKRYWHDELGGFVFVLSEQPGVLTNHWNYEHHHPAPTVKQLFSAATQREYPPQPTASPAERMFFWDTPPTPLVITGAGVHPKILVRQWEAKRHSLRIKEPF